MDKITMRDAKKMSDKSYGYNIMHIAWFGYQSAYTLLNGVDLESKHPDCSHVLVSPGKRWSDSNSVAALILKEDY